MPIKHGRQEIRELIVKKLKEVSFFNGVFESRVYNYSTDKMPGVLVYTTSEEAESEPLDERPFVRQLSVQIEGHAKGKNVDDILDQISLEVESSIREIISRTELFTYDGCDIEFSGDGSSQIGVITMRFNCTYEF